MPLDEEGKELQRQHKRRQKNRNRIKFICHLKGIIDNAQVQHQVFNRFITIPLEKGTYSWEGVPSAVDPSKFNLTGKRGRRKRQQCESFARAVGPIINQLCEKLGRSVQIVDFGSGTGNASLPLAYWFRDKANFTLVDRFPVPIKIAKERVADAELQNVDCVEGYIKDWKKKGMDFDLGFCSHACGSATDDALECCLEKGASFVLISCCVGKLKYVSEDISLPRSKWMGKLFSRDEFLELSRAGDHSGKDFEDEESEWKRECKLLLEIDRLELAKESLTTKYSLFLSKLEPLECSPKNDIICGYSPLVNL